MRAGATAEQIPPFPPEGWMRAVLRGLHILLVCGVLSVSRGCDRVQEGCIHSALRGSGVRNGSAWLEIFKLCLRGGRVLRQRPALQMA